MSSGGMRPIADTAGQQLIWAQPSPTIREHELRAGEALVATLSFERGTLANAEADAGSWTFKREGFWHPHVTVRVPGDETNIAVFRARTGGAGELVFSDGHVFRLASTNPMHSEWVWQQEDQLLVRFQGRRGVIKARARSTSNQRQSPYPSLPCWLCLAGI